MKQRLALTLASLFTLAACASDEPANEEIESTEHALDNPYQPDLTCHVTSPPGGTTGPIIDGTKSNGWCCGKALCIDEEICGEYYGEYVESCADCHYSECIPGTEAKGGLKGWRGVRLPLTPVKATLLQSR